MGPFVVVTSVLTVGLGAFAQADVIQPLYGTGPNWPQLSVEFGDGRGIYFTANASFDIHSVEFLAFLFSDESYQLVLFEGGGSQTLPTGAELHVVTFVPPLQTAESWLTIPFATSLVDDEDYVLLLRHAEGDYTQRRLTVHGGRTNQVTDDEDLGLVTYQSARSGPQGNDNNRYAPLIHLIVPEPNTTILLAVLSLALLARDRRLTTE